MPDNIPEKVVEVLSPPTVKSGVPPTTLVTAPDPAKDPIVSSKSFRSKVPFTVNTEASLIATAVPSFIVVPVPIVVAPE